MMTFENGDTKYKTFEPIGTNWTQGVVFDVVHRLRKEVRPAEKKLLKTVTKARDSVSEEN